MAMASGKETREYKSVRGSLRVIRDHLQATPGAKESLTVEYQEKEWIDIDENPDQVKFGIVALSRINLDASQYHVFMDMLQSIAGMDGVTKQIAGIVYTVTIF